MRYICTSIVATLLLAGTSLADTINVPGDYASIQAAIDASADGDEIIVAPGTYTSTQDGHVVDMKGKAVTLRASGTPEETIIDGQNARRGIACFSGESADCIIDGFTIDGGFAVQHEYPTGGQNFNGMSGGGIYVVLSSPTIQNCTITNCVATTHGGGICCYLGMARIIGCEIRNCTAWRGGGILGDLFKGSQLWLLDTVVAGNSATVAGGVSVSNGDVGIHDCQIVDNTASAWAGGIALANGELELANCLIDGNVSYDSTGGVFVNNNTTALISGCQISNNTTNEFGGGVRFSNGGSGIVIASIISGNTANFGGGVAVDDDSVANLTECSIAGNYARNAGGAIAVLEQGVVVVANCVASGNSALDSGGGIHCGSTNWPGLSGSDICENSPDQIDGAWTGDGDNAVLTLCDLDRDGVSDVIDNCDLFNPDQEDCNGNGVGDVCDIDSGFSEDLNQNAIPDECDCHADVVVDGEVDINDVLVTIASWGTSGPLGDVNYDGIVDIGDLLIVLGAWGPCP
jgi:hypothetical protein